MVARDNYGVVHLLNTQTLVKYEDGRAVCVAMCGQEFHVAHREATPITCLTCLAEDPQ